MKRHSPIELVVYDEPEPCPYLDGETARLPLRMLLSKLSPKQFDQQMAAGDRRHGSMLYRTTCPDCRACEPIRVDVQNFRPNRSQRRAIARGDRQLSIEIGPPVVDHERIDLFNRHGQFRRLSSSPGGIDADDYRDFLVDSCCETIEFAYRHAGQLAGVSIADRGAEAMSAVYCSWEPDLAHLSLGKYSILKQIETCRSWGMRWLYLGLYIARSPHMRYKSEFQPHERLIDGRWQRCERPDSQRSGPQRSRREESRDTAGSCESISGRPKR